MACALDIKVPTGLEAVFLPGLARLREPFDYRRAGTVSGWACMLGVQGQSSCLSGSGKAASNTGCHDETRRGIIAFRAAGFSGAAARAVAGINLSYEQAVQRGSSLVKRVREQE